MILRGGFPMRLVLSTLSLCWALPAAAQTAPASPAPAKEVIDTADVPAVPAAAANAAPAPTPAADSAGPADTVAAAPAPAAREPLAWNTGLLSRLDFFGTLQLKGLYHDMSADRDADKRLTLQLRRFKLGLEGAFDAHSGFRGDFLVDGNNKNFGVDDAFLFYRINGLMGFKGGKFKRPFSQEALQSSKSLYTIERGELYHDFLANTTGYAYYDLGVSAYGGFEDEGLALGYELGVFNGKQNDDAGKDYSGQQDEKQDKGFKAKDVVFRLTAAPFSLLKLEAAVSTKAAENTSDPSDFAYAVNTAYEAGADFHYDHLRLLGEVAWGDNHKKLDANIIDGGALFFAFYLTGIWREDYSRGRASELVLKLEGLDPDFEPGSAEGVPNDGKLRYTVGCNYFFTPAVSILADYGILQPITQVAGEDDLVHDFDLMWRMSF
jgi:hypothetical protein